ncbi:hypothetical protein BsWGS_19165 [Bradybaena similaris]
MVVRNDFNTLPVDRGWAWMIAVAGFITHVLLGGAVQTNALLFLEILEMFNASITAGSLVFMFMAIAFSLSTLVVTHFIMEKLTERGCLILGGIICSALTLASSFAPNIGVFIGLLSIKGFFFSLLFVPSISLLAHYFKRYRSRAGVLPFCGNSAAVVIGPFIIRAVRKEYGVMGAYMLLSACELHFCVAGLLLRPVSSYRFRPDDAKTPGNDAAPVTSPAPESTDADRHDDGADASNAKLLQVRSGEVAGDAESAEALLDLDDVDSALQETTVGDTQEPAHGKHAAQDSERPNTLSGSGARSGSEVSAALECKKNVTHTSAERRLTRWHKFYEATSLDLWAFRWTLLSMIPGSCVGYIINYLPTVCKFQGASLDQAAFLTTILGCVELAGRISVGFIADTHILLHSQLFAIALFGIGLGCHVLRFATTFETLIPVVILIGIFLGTRGPLQSLMCLDVVGAQKMPQAYSMLLVLITLFGSLFNPALGAVVEATGSFAPAMHIVGSCILLCAGLLACSPLFSRLDVKHGRKK